MAWREREHWTVGKWRNLESEGVGIERLELRRGQEYKLNGDGVKGAGFLLPLISFPPKQDRPK